MATSLGEGKLCIPTCFTPLKNDLVTYPGHGWVNTCMYSVFVYIHEFILCIKKQAKQPRKKQLSNKLFLQLFFFL